MVQVAFGDTGEDNTNSDHELAHHYKPNLLAIFVGVTHEGSESGLSLGIEYERRLSKSFGIGIVAEHTLGNLDFWVYALPLAYHTRSWKFYIAPGVADGGHGSESLVRFGGAYVFEVGGWEISPQLNADFVEGNEAIGLGVTFGKAF
jgi:hypothetical protein